MIRIYRSQRDYETDRARWLGGGWRVAESGQFAMTPEISQSAVHRPDEPQFVRVAYELRRL
jgi:hypothetical protein